MNRLAVFVDNCRRHFYVKHLRNKLKNKNFTLLCNDCVAGAIYHQFDLEFKSPTINLYMSHEDFLYYCCNLNTFKDFTLEELHSAEYNFPVGLLTSHNKNIHPIKLFFMHYSTFEEAKQKWINRSKRINDNNLYVLFDYTNENDINKSTIDSFNAVPYKKIMLYNKGVLGISDVKDSYGISFRNEHHTAKILEHYRGGHYFNQFDLVNWFNNK